MVDTSYRISECCGRNCDTGVRAVWEGVTVGVSTRVDVFE